MTDWESFVADDEVEIASEVDRLLLGFGKSIWIYPFGEGSTNQYGQAAKEFEEPIECTGRCILRPTKETLEIIGNLQGVDCALVFSRAEMIRKFPERDENEWLDEKDEFVYEERRYKILKVHPSGRIKNFHNVVVVLGANILGEFRE